MSRWKNLKRLLRMEGSIAELIGSLISVVGGFVVGLWFGRQLLNLF